MTKKQIIDVLKALRNFCKTRECCSDCELLYSCFFRRFPCDSTNKDIKLIADTLKAFIDGNEANRWMK